jgi:hypothetical protein
VILVIGFAIFLIFAYPGYMSPDSAVQLGQARTQEYTDGHPPAMAALWRLVELVVTGPVGMLLIQGSLFLIGLYWILRRHFVSPRNAAIAATAILLFPPVFAPMAVIWKDCQMAGFLTIGIALLIDQRPSRRWCGVVLIAVAIAMRHNALAAALPIFVLLYVWRSGQARWKRVAIALAIWMAASGAALTTNRLLTKVHEYPWHYSVGPADIVGTLHNSRRYEDAELLQVFEGTPLIMREDIFDRARHSYNPTLWWWYVNGPERLFDFPADEAQRDAIARAWKTLVTDNPVAYARHRLRVFRELLGFSSRFSNDAVFAPVWRIHMDQAQVADLKSSSAMQTAIGDLLDWLAETTPIYRPYIYFYLALIFLPFARRHREVLALLASGLIYEFTLIPFAPSVEYRYSHWMITCTVIATVILVRKRMASRDQPAAQGDPPPSVEAVAP